jgi:hypothetical protein
MDCLSPLHNDSRMSSDLLRGTRYVNWWRSRRLLPTRAHMNWSHQEGYIPVSESITQARTEKNNLELQMND